MGMALVCAWTATAAAAGEPCDGAVEGIHYSLWIDTTRHEEATEASAAFRLVRASGGRDVAMLLFADGIQVVGPDPVRHVPCGATARWGVRIPHAPGAPLDLHASPVPSPGIPDAFGPGGGVPPDEAEALDHAYDAADVAGVAFGPPRPPPAGIASSRGRRREARDADAYLSDDPDGRPVHVRVLPDGRERWDFRLHFGETFRRGGRFGITCLVDDRQMPAFDDRPLWFGTLARGEEVVIPASTPPLAPGWHQVRCLVLDGLFDGEERGMAWPYVIRSTFVFRRP